MRGLIPDSFIDELLARVDIVDVIERRVPLKKAGREWTACCPFHNERTPSFYVSPAKQFFHCFGCGVSGSAIKFLMDFDRLEFPDAVEELAQTVGLTVPREGGRDAAPREDKTDLYTLLDDTASWYERELPRSAEAQAYCKKRGLDADTIKRFRLGWAPAGYDGVIKALGNTPRRMELLIEAGMVSSGERGNKYDRFRERLMFPILDRRGRVIAFGGRVLSAEQSPKYLNSPETPLFHKGRELFALWQVKQANPKLERIVVVEGYMDVIALHQAGLPIAVATLGTATTPEHAELLFRTTADVVFCFDGDRAGRAAAWKALDATLTRMRDGKQANFLFLPDGEDPDTLIRQEGKVGFERRIKEESVPLSEYFFQFLEAASDLSTADGRARLREHCKEYIRKIPDGAFRDQMVALLQERTITTPKFLAAIDPALHDAAMDVFNEKLAVTRRELGLHEADSLLSPTKASHQEVPEYKRTLVRSAIATLLAQPGLASLLDKPYRFMALDKPGVRLLAELIDVARARPGISTGALIEHFVQSSDYGALQKLAIMPIIGEPETQRAVFLDALQRMDEQAAALRCEALRTKMRSSSLDDAEKAELRELLAARVRPPVASA